MEKRHFLSKFNSKKVDFKFVNKAYNLHVFLINTAGPESLEDKRPVEV